MLNSNIIFISKRKKIIVPKKGSTENLLLARAFFINLKSLGYTVSKDLAERLIWLSEEQLGALYRELIPALKQMRGAHRKFVPMYPNFPKEVEETSEMQLFIDALEYAWEFKLPPKEIKFRKSLDEINKLEVIDVGTPQEFFSIFTNLLKAKTSLSAADNEIIHWFIKNQTSHLQQIIPTEIPLKENLALVLKLLLTETGQTYGVDTQIKTPTDILRVIVALSGGDVSLSAPTKFKSLGRKIRRVFLARLNSMPHLAEEMERHHNTWIRVGEILHPGEYQKAYPKAFEAFQKLRSGEKIATFAGKVQETIKTQPLQTAKLLKTRPGEFARKIDEVLRNAKSRDEQDQILKEFKKVAQDVSTPVLLQVLAHFKNRGGTRHVFPKGALAKLQTIPPAPALPAEVTGAAYQSTRESLVSKLKHFPSLGKVYVDPSLEDYLVPFSERSASKALRTIVRGSRIPLNRQKDTLRFFLWWKGCTDIDLSAVMTSADLSTIDTIGYFSLKTQFGYHSGDIRNAPSGASEFIDIHIPTCQKRGVRYVIMSIHCFSGTPFVELEECFAGWMMREDPNSGEIYEPTTVENKIDLTTPTLAAIPLIIDLLEMKVIWMDLPLKSQVHGNVLSDNGKIGKVCRAILDTKKPTLHDLFIIHGEARGQLVTSKEEADTIFSPSEGITPFDQDRIISEFLA